MYTKLTKLDPSKISILENLKSQVPYRSDNIRVGASGNNKMSIYSYSKWFAWSRIQRNEFKQAVGKELADQAMAGWFLNFPANRGFLDLMTYWQDKVMAGRVISYALADQDIWLNGQKITILKGEGIQFSLKIPHEIKQSSRDQAWACLLLLK